MRQHLILFALLAQIAALPAPAQQTEKSNMPHKSLQAPLDDARGGVPNPSTQTAPTKFVADRLAVPPTAVTGPDYTLGAGDSVEVTVIGIPGLERKEFALDGRGRISLPYVNQLSLLGLSAHDAEVKIAALFGESLLEDPQVSVSVKEYKSQFFYVLGAVKKPGTQQITRQVTLLDALNMAGGLSENADTRIQIRRGSTRNEDSAGPGEESSPTPLAAGVPGAVLPHATMEVDLFELIEKGDPTKNVAIMSGDVISVSEKQEMFYYVLGDVQKPGAFLLRGSERVSLSKAIAKAGGVLKTASAGKTTIIRQKPGSELPEQIKVDAMAVVRGDIKDIDLLENDVILVPGSASKAVGKTLMGGLGGFVTSLIVMGIR